MATPVIAKAESDDSMGAGFSWTFPGAPIRINIPLHLIAKLRAELDQQESSGNLASTEVGGLLLGYQKNLTTIEIDDYLWVASKSPSDGQYSLDISILERLRSEYGARPGNGDRQPQVLGYFRTQSKDHLHLRVQEIGLVREHFHDPTNVALLILTSTRPPTAGYFFWMEKDVLAPVSFKDFPLDAKVLRLQAQPHAADIPVSQPVEEKKMALRLRSMARENTPARAVTEPVETSRTATAAQKEPKRISPRMMAVTGALCAALVLAGLSVFLLRERGLSKPPQPTSAPVTTLPLQLEVEAQGNGLNVRWNPQSVPVLHGREGHLVILDGDRQPQIIQLDSQQLTSGHVYYRSSSERIQFQLEIVDQSGKASRESVLALSSKPPPSAIPTPPSQTGNGQSQTRIVESIPIRSTDADALRLGTAMDGVPKRPPTPREFVAPTRSAPAGRIQAIVLDQPPAVPSDTSLPLTAGLPAALNTLPPPLNGPRVTPQTKIGGGNVQGATLIRRVEPLYPPLALTGHIEGSVRFSVLIGKDGTVRNLQVISGVPVLIRAASDAVKQWIYRPFLLDGQPVEGVTQLDVHFTLRR